jgi:hypothetical protein
MFLETLSWNHAFSYLLEGLKIMDMHVVLLKALSWSKVEVSSNFVNKQIPVYLTSFSNLFGKLLAKTFALALIPSVIT